MFPTEVNTKLGRSIDVGNDNGEAMSPLWHLNTIAGRRGTNYVSAEDDRR